MIDVLNCTLVSERMIGKPERTQGDRNISDFKYTCVGYSIYLDDKETSVGVHEKKADVQLRELPVCVGFEVLVGRGDPVNKSPSYNKKEGKKKTFSSFQDLYVC